MPINKVILVLALFLNLGLHAQNGNSRFMAFGKTPTVVDPILYDQLKNAHTTTKRLQGLDTIAQIFLMTDYADSLVAYADLMKNELLASGTGIEPTFYRARAVYYEGIAMQQFGLLDESVAVFITGIGDFQKKKSPMKAYMQLGLAQTYILENQTIKALEILEELAQQNHGGHFAMEADLTMADLFLRDNDLGQAQKKFDEIITSSKIDSFPKIQLQSQLGLGQILRKKENYDKAIIAFAKAKQSSLTGRYYDLYIRATLLEGDTYSQLGAFDIAEVALHTAYINSLQWNRGELQLQIIGALRLLYVQKGNYENAYALMTQYVAIKQEISNKQNARFVRDLEIKYESLKKEREIDDLQEEQLIKQAEIGRQKTIKNAILIGFLIILVPILLLLYVYYQKIQAQSTLAAQQEILNQQEVRSLLQAQELKLARTAMSVQREERDRIARELHDSIGGNLAGIKLQFNTLGDSDAVKDQILGQLDATYELVREISHSLIPGAFKDQAFSQLVKDFMSPFNKDPTVQYNFNAYPEEAIDGLPEALQVTLFNIIKELITNASKYAEANVVEIQLGLQEGEQMLELLYEDDGVGFDLEETGGGLGLKNMQKRVNDLDGLLMINSSLGRGTVVTISIPRI